MHFFIWENFLRHRAFIKREMTIILLWRLEQNEKQPNYYLWHVLTILHVTYFMPQAQTWSFISCFICSILGKFPPLFSPSFFPSVYRYISNTSCKRYGYFCNKYHTKIDHATVFTFLLFTFLHHRYRYFLLGTALYMINVDEYSHKVLYLLTYLHS